MTYEKKKRNFVKPSYWKQERFSLHTYHKKMIVGIINELYEGLGPILFYVVLSSVLLHVIALVREPFQFASFDRYFSIRVVRSHLKI